MNVPATRQTTDARNALIVVDIQNDFLPGGALAVPEGDAVISPTNALMRQYDLVVATQDWHPANHGSFASNHHGRAPGELVELDGIEQILWPEHCVQGSPGAGFAAKLETGQLDAVFRKGCDPLVDSYSGFSDNQGRNDSGLASWLEARSIREVGIVGLALDYCVKFTALDAAALGLDVHLHLLACRAVNLDPLDGGRAVAEMRAAGVHVVESSATAGERTAGR
jgi:nicotinamidase/pyrazinamidase